MKRRFRCIESSFFCDFFDFGGAKLLFCAVHTHVSWSFFVAQGFRSCGSDEGALRSPPSTPSRCTRPGFWGDEVESTREHSMQLRSTQSRERGKGGTPLRSPEAEPLVGSRGKAPWVTPSTSPQSARKHLSGFPSRSAARCACRSSCRCRKSAGRSGNRTCPRRIRPSAAACCRGSRRRGP